jgi:3-hydroxymyristoyl/3-hydroxydecanoyl-(acyl carrier protein) dehydratase
MSTLAFKHRPVAGLAGRIELLSPVRPGQTLDLTADLDTVESDAVAYGGSASVNGAPVIRLEHCVGPMMPLEDFDDPAAVQDRFGVLSGPGATPGGFQGVKPIRFEATGGETGQWKSASLQVPESARFFADHFPRRPVFPGTLLMNCNMELASALASELPPVNGFPWKVRSVSDVKLRSFTPPGEILECVARVADISASTTTVSVETRKGKRVVGGAKVMLIAERDR